MAVILTILVAGCIAGCWTETESRWIIPEPMFYSEEDLENLYFDHKETFQEVVEIVLGSDSFLQYIRDSKEGDGDISMKSDRRYFAQEDWAKIETLLKRSSLIWSCDQLRVGKILYTLLFEDKS